MKQFIIRVSYSQTNRQTVLVEAETYEEALRASKKAFPSATCFDKLGIIHSFLKAEEMFDEEEEAATVRLAELQNRLDSIKEIAAKEIQTIANEAAEEMIRLRNEHGGSGLVGDPQ